MREYKKERESVTENVRRERMLKRYIKWAENVKTRECEKGRE